MPAIDKAGSDNIRRVYLKVDLSGYQSSNVTTALLQLQITSADEGSFFDVYPCYDDSWSEANITWNNKPAFDAVFIDQVKPAVLSGLVQIDVTDFVNEQLGGDKVASFVVAEQYQRETAVVFGSSECAVPGNRPSLLMDGNALIVLEDSYVNSADATVNYGNDTTLNAFDGWDYSNSTYTPGMEIDIHETLGIWGPNKTQHAWHWNGYAADHQSGHSPVETTEDQNEFRTFGVYWTKGKIEFYIDGQNTYTHIGAEVCAVPSYMIISGQLGGWDNNGTDLETCFDPYLPLHLDVDYVKVWAGAKTGDSTYVPPETPSSLAIYTDTSTLNISVVQEKDCVVEEIASDAHEGDHAYEMAYDFTGWYTQFKLVVDNWAGHFAMSGFNVFSFAHKGAEGLNISVMLVEPGTEGAVTELGPVAGSADWQVDSITFSPSVGNYQAIQFEIGGAGSAAGTLLLDDIWGYRVEPTAVAGDAGSHNMAVPAGQALSRIPSSTVLLYGLNGRCISRHLPQKGARPAQGVYAIYEPGKKTRIATCLTH